MSYPRPSPASCAAPGQGPGRTAQYSRVKKVHASGIMTKFSEIFPSSLSDSRLSNNKGCGGIEAGFTQQRVLTRLISALFKQ